ncbi:acetate uptake transporter family protein [Streptomonospora wellingtoniae]|uniref:GPR1/FUN34/YaaH family transporter n=1 Tax=Streptomonospora wellingtoniae TaxID=3075544 RepID=A0ABU2KQ81_9ACTN|nr:GPR1/FUN34/YaaH family transporter [Streptomonospora sp. DSM 45055]MDT0301424.1 GPR1/FUN34/YaaH family transporter [Streptomonospora sp. DSM 45055]
MTGPAPERPSDEGTDPDRPAVRIGLRPIASPAPVGFMALAVATLMLSSLQLGWLPASERDHVSLVLIAFAFPLQLLGCVFGFLGRDIVVGTGMGILGGTWLSTAVVSLTSPPGVIAVPTLGVLMLAASVGLLVPAAGAATGKLLAAAVLLAASARFALTAGYELTGAPIWATVSGTAGVALSVLALYGALALLIEDISKRTVLPVFRRGDSRASMGGNLRAQLGSIEREAGVREQL